MKRFHWLILVLSFLFGLPRTGAAVPSTADAYKRSISCGCEEETLGSLSYWVDVVFVVDSSDGVSDSDFAEVSQFLMLMTQLGLDYTLGSLQYTRLAIINTASVANVLVDLKTPRTGPEVQQIIKTELRKLGGSTFNAEAGLQAAQHMIEDEESSGRRRNVQKVVVMFSTRSIFCNFGTSSGTTTLCGLLSALESQKSSMIAIGLRLYGITDFPHIDLVAKCNELIYVDTIVEDILRALCRANCYCPPPFTQFIIGDGGCDRYGKCVQVQKGLLPYHAARYMCHVASTTLATVFCEEERQFLLDLHLAANALPYWIGMNCSSSVCTADDTTTYGASDYKAWCTSHSQPDFRRGYCVYEDQCDAFKTGWYSDECGDVYPAHYFACEKQACTAQHYCGDTGSEF